jgi:hypothetical protein
MPGAPASNWLERVQEEGLPWLRPVARYQGA